MMVDIEQLDMDERDDNEHDEYIMLMAQKEAENNWWAHGDGSDWYGY